MKKIVSLLLVIIICLITGYSFADNPEPRDIMLSILSISFASPRETTYKIFGKPEWSNPEYHNPNIIYDGWSYDDPDGQFYLKTCSLGIYYDISYGSAKIIEISYNRGYDSVELALDTYNQLEKYLSTLYIKIIEEAYTYGSLFSCWKDNENNFISLSFRDETVFDSSVNKASISFSYKSASEYNYIKTNLENKYPLKNYNPLEQGRKIYIWKPSNIRGGAGLNYPIVGSASVGDTFNCLEEIHDWSNNISWFKVRLSNGDNGYISSGNAYYK